MSDHKHGEMDVTTQERTFEAFNKFSARVAIFVVCLLIFLALVNG